MNRVGELASEFISKWMCVGVVLRNMWHFSKPQARKITNSQAILALGSSPRARKLGGVTETHERENNKAYPQWIRGWMVS